MAACPAGVRFLSARGAVQRLLGLVAEGEGERPDPVLGGAWRGVKGVGGMDEWILGVACAKGVGVWMSGSWCMM